MRNILNNKRIVMIIPYFGKIPDYFALWLRTAEANSEYTFFLYSDLPFPVEETSNVKVKYMTFDQLQNRIREKLGYGCVINEPYKLCDYKPAYGVIFADDITEFDFWGFCDVDLLFGDLSNFISQDMLHQYDKIYDHGHFCLMRNNEKMNTLYKTTYPNVLDYSYVVRTNYCCHFDENGTISYVSEYDRDIRCFTEWNFYDVPCESYRMLLGGDEVFAVWQSGQLKLYRMDRTLLGESMYIHLQKRKMSGMWRHFGDSIVVCRDEFMNELPSENCSVDLNKERVFLKSRRRSRHREIVRNILNGAFRFRLYRFLFRWQQK